MKVLKILGFILFAVIAIGAILVLMQPAKGHVEQSIIVNAPPSAVFKYVNGFKTFRNWSPWAKMDPSAKYTFEGPEEGVGAKMSWDGKETGKGTQWVEESVPNERVKNALAFDGYDGKAYAVFILKPEGDGTLVTWVYDGENKGIGGKMMWLFMGGVMDGWFKQGLQDLKTDIESNPAPADSTVPNP